MSFTCRLKTYHGESAQMPGQACAIPRFSGQKILLVEDNLINQEIFVALLVRTGLRVTVANNGREALDILRSEHAVEEPFSLIFMDLQMPGMDGYEATAIIREDNSLPDVPIIALTASALQSEREQCLQLGMADHIAKPIDIGRLHSILARYLIQPETYGTSSQQEQEAVP